MDPARVTFVSLSMLVSFVLSFGHTNQHFNGNAFRFLLGSVVRIVLVFIRSHFGSRMLFIFKYVVSFCVVFFSVVRRLNVLAP